MITLLLAALVYGPYQAKLVRVTGPDTLVVNVAVWPGQVNRVTIDVAGIVTPKPDGACEAERLMAREGIDFTRHFLGSRITLEQVHPARVPGTYYAGVRNGEGRDLSRALLEAGYALPFVKGKKASWCPR